ncbi:MAG: 5'/3'-nucleotidase SurE [Magnetovibrio sp.]|nr:5'/3'-nucleotidase SurE [Magnetovibrio sp.]|tara:strand:+ start:692 stop:1459 length:768 start_codon:yes stop_codon:yes gene_type:complete
MNLSRSRVLLSNDDGINAPGMKVLACLARELFQEVWIVAPESEQSASSHSLTLRRPLRIRKLSKRRYSVDGTPADSVLLGVREIMKDAPPDLLISGINRGGNLGEDVTYSGTVAAAMEGTLLGIPSIALSQFFYKRENLSWGTAEAWTGRVLKIFSKFDWTPGVLMNVNFPDVPAKDVIGIEFVRQGRRKIGGDFKLGNDPRGDPYFWIGVQRNENKFRKGSDLEAIIRGAVAITPLTLDLTHSNTLRKLKGLVK